MYKKAREGVIKDFTGVNDPYEEPPNPEIIIETDSETVDQSVQNVLSYLQMRGLIPG